uniref:SRCR domain-containing protein n=1 Tax=Chrysemys picta bellii TaxID=8478 RepID=A0A8C3IX13_CHRPI
ASVSPPTLCLLSLTMSEWSMRLTGSGCRCSGLLEVNSGGSLARVCSSVWNQKVTKMVCAELGCGSPSNDVLKLDSEQKFMERMKPNCQGNGTTLKNCHWEKSNCTQDITVVCKGRSHLPLYGVLRTELELQATTKSRRTDAPPRMRLVDGRFHCSGIVELYMGGHWGTVQSSPENKTKLDSWVCQKMGCGDALDQKNRSFLVKNEKQHLPVHWEMVASCRSTSIPDCFNRTRNSQKKTPASVICSGSQPRMMRRLGDSQSPCEGVMEVFHEGKWKVLCDSSSLWESRGQQVCQELQCGNFFSSVQVQGAETWGVSCSEQHIQECSTFHRVKCFKTRVTCQNFKPRSAGVGAGTIVSILLALILLGVLIIICGPPAYKKLQKKCTMCDCLSFTPPRSLGQVLISLTQLGVTLPLAPMSISPLEGAIRSSNPPDNSSDSDYDLHSARRL